jgi:hypothetical protein
MLEPFSVSGPGKQVRHVCPSNVTGVLANG